MNKFLLLITLSFVFSIHSQNLDIDILKDINQSYTAQGGKPMQFFSNSVTPAAIGVPVSVFCIAAICKKKNIAFDGLYLASAELFSSLITTPLKLSIKRERPFSKYPNDITKYSSGGSYSFPSGHTSMAFSVATAVALTYPKWYIITPSFLWASGVGYSRMYLGVHYPSDVLVGAIVGAGSSLAMYYGRKYLVERKEKKKNLSLY